MKRAIVMLLALGMLLTLCACGGKSGGEPVRKENLPSAKITKATSPPIPEAPEALFAEPAASPEPVSAVVGDYRITIVAAESFSDIDCMPAIRFYYDITNESDEIRCPGSELTIFAAQGGFGVDYTYGPDACDVPELINADKHILPGVTVRCVEEFRYEPGDGILLFRVEDPSGEEFVAMYFDPEDLQGRPEPMEMPAITEPDAHGLNEEGLIGDSFAVRINGCETDTDAEGNDIVRVFVEFTNNSGKATSPFFETYFLVMQDGVELEEAQAAETAEADDNYFWDVEPGESILCSQCYTLRTDSPIAFMVHDGQNEIKIGAVFSID